MLAGLPILEEQMPSSEIWLKRRKDLVSRVLSLACVLCSIVMASNNHYSYDPGCLGYGNNLGYGVQPGDGNPNIDRPNVPRYPQLNSLDNNVYYPPNQGHISSYESPIQNPGAVNGYTHPSMYPPQHLQVNQDPGYVLGEPPGTQNIAGSMLRSNGPSRAPDGLVGRDLNLGTQTSRVLGEEYERQDRNFFVPGAVFSILWTEPAGQFSRKSGRITPTLYEGENAYTHIRRFAVFSQKNKHALCVPITTYSNQATMKRGINRDAHAIIYSSGQPRLLPGERPLSKRPIKVDSEAQLWESSRINFEKVYTVEYNQKVALVGHVARKDFPYFKTYAKEAVEP